VRSELVLFPEGMNMEEKCLARTGTRRLLSKRAFALVLSLSLLLPLAAQAGSGRKGEKAGALDSIDISNFGKVDDHFYRGAQPKGNQYQALAAIGVKTIIDLRDDPKDQAKAAAEQAGLHYINFPLDDKRYPAPDAAPRFLEITNNPANWPIYVHCAGGRHRTGAMTAIYRMAVKGWDADRAYQEMKQYDFYTRWGHGAMKDYVYDYYRQLSQKRSQQATAAQTPSVSNSN